MPPVYVSFFLITLKTEPAQFEMHFLSKLFFGKLTSSCSKTPICDGADS